MQNYASTAARCTALHPKTCILLPSPCGCHWLVSPDRDLIPFHLRWEENNKGLRGTRGQRFRNARKGFGGRKVGLWGEERRVWVTRGRVSRVAKKGLWRMQGTIFGGCKKNYFWRKQGKTDTQQKNHPMAAPITGGGDPKLDPNLQKLQVGDPIPNPKLDPNLC